MDIFYDKVMKGFYNKQNEDNSRYKISNEYWGELLDKQTIGYQIEPDELGKPIAVQPIVTAKEQKENRICELKKLLEETDYVVIKLYELKVTGNTEFETEFSRYKGIMKQREDWRKEVDLLLAEIQQ